MDLLKKTSQRTRVLLLGVIVPGLIVSVLGGLYYRNCKKRAVQVCVNKARTLCLSAESTREHMEEQWAAGVYSQTDLQQWAKDDLNEKVLSTVPIAAAMNAICRKQETGGYTFRVPAFDPRNTDNTPTSFQAEALRELESGRVTELVRIDRAANTAHYFRPVILGQSCMMCHGDPATAEATWGNADGTDVTGYQMENWKPGDVHGAFEIVQSLDEADAAASQAITQVGIGVFASLLVCGGLSIVVLRSIQVDEKQHASAVGGEIAQRLSEDTTHIASAIEELSSNVRNIAESASIASDTAKGVVTRVQATNQKSEDLDESSRKIGDVVQLIETIAEQTNLLALNATIEAARAGDAGKGFAVVAGEVKGLAQQTSEATGTITSQIGSIQDTSSGLLQELREMKDIIDTIDSAQEEISGAVHQQQAATEEISRSVHSVLESSRSLSERLEVRGP